MLASNLVSPLWAVGDSGLPKLRTEDRLRILHKRAQEAPRITGVDDVLACSFGRTEWRGDRLQATLDLRQLCRRVSRRFDFAPVGRGDTAFDVH